ncbi:hypothetical protein MNV49_003387, partial [Pseudohyphozyma bogoriensis]
AGPSTLPPPAAGAAAPAHGTTVPKTGPIRVMAKTFNPATQACIRCHNRKRKCDRVQPACGRCTKLGMDCVFEVKITDRTHPGYVPGLITEVEALKARVAWLESLSKRIDPSSRLLQSISDVATGTTIHARPPTKAIKTGGSGSATPSDAPSPASFGEEQRGATVRTATSTSSWSTVAKQILRLNVPTLANGVGDVGEQDPSDEDEVEVDTSMEVAELPPYEQACIISQAYFNNTAAVQSPYASSATFDQELILMYRDNITSLKDPTQFQRGIIFRVFLVLALGITQLDKLGAVGNWGSAASYYNRAMLETEGVLVKEDVTMFQPKGLSLWSLAGLASRLAIGLGLHRKVDTSRNNISERALEERRVTWWSVYSLDRIVAFSLGRPVAIEDEDIDVELPTIAANPALNLPPGSLPQVDYRRHTIMMRQLGGIIQRIVYRKPSPETTLEQREDMLRRLHARVDDWYEATPTGPAEVLSGMTRSNYFSAWKELFISAMYRPSPLLPKITKSRLQILRASSTRSIELFWKLHGERSIASNVINLQHMFIGSISLLFCLNEYDGDERNSHSATWRQEAVQLLQSCSDLLSSFSIGWPATNKFQQTFDKLAELLIIKCHSAALSQVSLSQSQPASTQNVHLSSVDMVGAPMATPNNVAIALPTPDTTPLAVLPSYDTIPIPASVPEQPIVTDDPYNTHAMMSNLWVGTDAILGQYLDLDGIPPQDESIQLSPDYSVDPFTSYTAFDHSKFGTFD